MTDTPADDGRSPAWLPDGVPLSVWETVRAEVSLSGAQIARLRMALDTLHAAEQAEAEAGQMSDRDRLAALAGARSARAAVDRLVAALTGDATTDGKPGPARKVGTLHGHRSRVERRERGEEV
ncbi:hypothetical protein [Micromonospora sp. NPDC005254]|uniref:hypothetical protein n=1 Tax=Micromonospora sp. NPDC005254 TaxID=3364229 RepID=UPI0036A651E5